MSFTEQTLATTAYEALRARGADVPASLIPRLISRIPAALERLGESVRDSPDYLDMQADFTATPVAGFLDLSALTGILFSMARSSVRVSATNDRLTPVDDLLTLQEAGLPVDEVYYARDGLGLRFRSTTPSLTDYATAVKIRANYVPSLTDVNRPVPLRFEGALVDILAGLVSPGVREEAA